MLGEKYTVTKTGKIGIIGLGFVGLPLALAFIRKGFQVIGIDVDEPKLKMLRSKKSYLTDIEDAEIASVLTAGSLSVSNSYAQLKNVENVIICVPTPLTPEHTPDLGYLTSTCNRLFPYLQKNQLVVLESSTFPGTTKEVVQPILENSGLRAGIDFYLAYSPERIDPGSKQLSLEQIPKVVSGLTAQCLKLIVTLYSQVFDQVVPVSTTETAETTKLLENTFRLVNISFINEFAQICHALQVDVWEVIAAASTKPYGFTPFYPSAGAGGHCIPVDPLYLQWSAVQLGMHSQFIELAHRVNESMSGYIWGQLKTYLLQQKPFSKPSVLIYGVTYKRDTPDIRESTALPLIALMLRDGVHVNYHDPLVPQLQVAGTTLHSTDLTKEALRESDCVLIHTDHTAIPVSFLLAHASLIYDTRNAMKDKTGSATVIKLGGGYA
ncbi:nucleotide sugar dehydrogenase [Paenibacillus aestuarii]|uniref:Nucleotide sugar dehydrogenase n=1 Tax=Paenibacillus aestuarii TaxID=516965 RepID=A0ABW0K3Q4_9BACL|nr:nucleotide sugar dehydrogenase [Paenibacillus aestuarii]